MLRKLAEYSLLSFFSFGIFTFIFHTVANAQTSVQPHEKEKTLSIAENKRQLLSPTPTVYFQPTPPPEITQAIISKETTDSPTPTTAPSSNKKTHQVTTSTPTPKQTATLTPTTIPATPTPVAQQTTSGGGARAEKLFSMVNAHRQTRGLQALQRDDRSCQLAAARAHEIAGEMAVGTLHSGMYARNLPYWNTENAIALPSEEAALNWWLSDAIHRQAIESSSHTHSCTACSGIYCVQEFTSYQPK